MSKLVRSRARAIRFRSHHVLRAVGFALIVIGVWSALASIRSAQIYFEYDHIGISYRLRNESAAPVGRADYVTLPLRWISYAVSAALASLILYLMLFRKRSVPVRDDGAEEPMVQE